MANRRITEFPAINGIDINEQDLLTLVHVFEVDPTLRNKKITFEQFKDYLNTYYASISGTTFSGNVAISGNLTVSGLGSFGTILSSGLSTFSGIVVQNNAVVSGTVSGTTITGANLQGVNVNATTVTTTTATGTTALFTSGQYQSLSGATITGGQGSFTSGTFVDLSGTTITGTTVAAATGTFQTLSTPVLNVSGNLSVASGLTVSGTAQFASTVQVTGTLSGTTVTGTTARFSTVSGVSGVFTTNLSGATITGNTVLVSNITGVSGVFTTRVSGATVTGNTGSFGNVSGISGVFTQFLSGAVITGDAGRFTAITGVSGVYTNLSGAAVTGNTVAATSITGVTGVFTSRISGVTVTGTTAAFTTISGISGVFTTNLSGATITGNSGQFSNLTVGTGNFARVSGTTVTGDTGAFTNLTGIVGVFTTSVSGTTVIGATVTGATGTFTSLTGVTITGTTVNATTGVFNTLQAVNLSFTDTTVSGNLTVLGSGSFGSGISVTGTISGITVTGTSGQFANIAANTANFTTATGVTASFTTITGITVTGTTANFTSGNFVSISGGTYIATSGVFASGTAANPSLSFIGDSNTGIYTSAADQVSITTSGVERLRVDSTGQIEAVSLGTASAPTYSFTTDPNTGIYSPGADQLAISTGGSGRLFVGSTGNTEIISAGSTPLQVSASLPRIRSSDSDGTNLYADFYTNNGTAFIDSRNDAANGAIIFRGLGGGVASEYMRITSAGLVGMGTTAPSTLFHANGTGLLDSLGNFSSSTDNTAKSLIVASTGATGGVGQLGASIAFSRINTTSPRAAIVAVQTNVNNERMGLSFWTHPTSIGTDPLVEAMRIIDNGDVGIGTTSPDAKLTTVSTRAADVLSLSSYFDVNGSAGDKNRFVLGCSSGSSRGIEIVAEKPGSSNAHNIIFANSRGDSAPQEAARIDSSGGLLIGSTIARGNFDNSTVTPQLQVEASSRSQSSLALIANGSATASNPYPSLFLGRSRGTLGTNVLVNDNDVVGGVSFQGNDGTEFVAAALITGVIDGTPGANDMPGRLVFSTTADGASSPTERMRITNGGVILCGKTGTAFSTAGSSIFPAGGVELTRSSGGLLFLNRLTNDGDLVTFYQDNVAEGSISISGTTVSYNGAHLSRWSQLPSGAERTEILRGSVLSNIDEMCEWGNEDNEQLNRMKVSDVEGDKNVSGVFQAWDDDDDTYTNDFYCAMTGDFIIRIGAGTTVERGDLLMSAGDGTAKSQDDDIIRSKTIAKVTSTNVSCTYADGSYCVPCVLMAC